MPTETSPARASPASGESPNSTLANWANGVSPFLASSLEARRISLEPANLVDSADSSESPFDRRSLSATTGGIPALVSSSFHFSIT